MRPEWIDVRVQVSHVSLDAGELVGLLNDPWTAGAWQEDGLIHLYWPKDRWSESTHQELTALMKRFGVDAGSLTVHSILDEDWNAAWARSVTTLRVGRRIVIRPSWESVMLNPEDVELILDPKQAFGTGHHATTQLLLEWLERHMQGGERVLDVGTGSGILAMVALRLGAASAWGIDHDPVAIECARGYALDNGFGPELRLDMSALAHICGEPFTLVLANLDRRTLLALQSDLPRVLGPRGRLVLSGLLSHDRVDLVDAFSSAGATLTWESQRDGWLAMAFTCHHEGFL